MTKKWTNYLVFGIPLLISFSLFYLTTTGEFQNSISELSRGITLDFLITIPLVYALLIWKREIPKFTIVTVFIICIITASYVLPESQQGLLQQVKFIAVPVLEIGIFTFLIFKMRSISKSFKEEGRTDLDFYDKLKLACASAFPGRVGELLATEMSVIYYALFPAKAIPLKENEYSYYKKSGIKSIIWVFLGLVFVEVGVVHLIVAQSNEKLAWILSAISLYALVQFLSLMRSMDRRHIEIDKENKELHLRYGFFAQTTIPFDKIKDIDKNKRSLPTDKSIIKLSPLDMLDSHNIIIKLKESLILDKIYGIKKEYKGIAIYVDEDLKFLEAMQACV